MLDPKQVASEGPGGFKNTLGGPTDPHYSLADGSPYPDKAAACATIPAAARKYRTVVVYTAGKPEGVEHWWTTDLRDEGLHVKPGGAVIPVTYTADVDILQGQLVARTPTGIKRYDAASLTARHSLLGVALQSASAGGNVDVQTEVGNVTIVGWGLTPGLHYQAGPGGQLTATPTGVAFQHRIGLALTADILYYFPSPLILL